MKSDVLDALMHLFDDFAQADSLPVDVDILQQLEALGFNAQDVEQACEWLKHAPEAPAHIETVKTASATAMRVYHPLEIAQLSPTCWDMLMMLERTGVLTPQMREAVIVQMMALDIHSIDSQELKWLSLLTLAEQPLDDATIMRLLKHLMRMAEDHEPEEVN